MGDSIRGSVNRDMFYVLLKNVVKGHISIIILTIQNVLLLLSDISRCHAAITGSIHTKD